MQNSMEQPQVLPAGHHLTILCVDDSTGALLVRKMLLESVGYDVLTATDGTEGLKLFRSSHIDLVISDHLLPGYSGAELARRMKLAKPLVPIMLFSGVVEMPEGLKSADLFMSKAEGPVKFLENVAELLGRERAA